MNRYLSWQFRELISAQSHTTKKGVGYFHLDYLAQWCSRYVPGRSRGIPVGILIEEVITHGSPQFTDELSHQYNILLDAFSLCILPDIL